MDGTLEKKKARWCYDGRQLHFDHCSDEQNPVDSLGKWTPPKKKRASTSYLLNQRNAIRPLYI